MNSRRGLLRPHGSSNGKPVFRNFPLFIFLAALVIFFYVFYVYQAQNTVLRSTQEQYDLMKVQLMKINEENVELRAAVEGLKTSNEQLKTEGATCKSSSKTCEEDLKKVKVERNKLNEDSVQMKTEANKCKQSYTSLREEMVKYNQTLKELMNVSALKDAKISELQDKISRSGMKQVDSGGVAGAGQTLKAGLDTLPLGKLLGIPVLNESVRGLDASVSDKIKSFTKAAGVASPNASTMPKAFDAAQEMLKAPPIMKNDFAAVGKNDNDVLLIPKGNVGEVRSKDLLLRKGDSKTNDEGRLVVPGGDYFDGDEGKRDEAVPDFDNDEKHLREPDI